MTTNDTLTDEIDSDTRLGMLALRTDWPDVIEILEVNDEEETVTGRINSIDVRNDVCKWIAAQGWIVTVSRGLNATMRVDNGDLPGPEYAL